MSPTTLTDTSLNILSTPTFSRAVKRLNANQKANLDEAIRYLMAHPEAGDSKVGDLAGVRVWKFRMNRQLALLAYSHDGERLILTLLALGSHENFYRDLKAD